MGVTKKREKAISRVGYNLRLTEDLHERISDYSYASGQSINEIINRAVDELLNREAAKK